MTENLLTHAYERLTTALEPPVDHRERVAARVAQLRRRRRSVQVLASASVAAAVVGAVAVASTVGGPAPAADDTVPAASSSASGTDPGPTTDPTGRDSCVREPPPSDATSGPHPPLRRLLEQIEAPEVVAVRFRDDGNRTTAYLVGDDGTTRLELHAHRADGGWRVVVLTRCS